MNVGKLIVGVIFGIIAQIIVFFQLQGPMKYDWFKNNYWVVVFMGIPASMFFMYSVKNLVMAYDGQMWPSRLIGFSLGAIVFTYFSWYLFSEPFSTKTIICLILSFAILAIQLFVK